MTSEQLCIAKVARVRASTDLMYSLLSRLQRWILAVEHRSVRIEQLTLAYMIREAWLVRRVDWETSSSERGISLV